MGAMQCPKCGHDAVVFEEVRRTVTQYSIIEDDGKRVVVSTQARKKEVIDSLGNEDRFYCLGCNHTFDLDFDVYEGVEAVDGLFVDELRERAGWDEDAVVEALDELVHELASRHGSNVNNGGLLEQVSYILRELGDAEGKKEIARIINDLK
jgi:hypothetical protein